MQQNYVYNNVYCMYIYIKYIYYMYVYIILLSPTNEQPTPPGTHAGALVTYIL